MNKTRVDDMLIEMITPKVQEIESKFTNGEGLTQEDINTLLLKSQYNHINHLDSKLNEVTADVASLKANFKNLEDKVESKIDNLKGEFQTFKAEITAENEKRFGALETKFGTLETKFESLRADIQTTISNTMKWYIGGAGIILVLLKALDLFIKK